MNCEPFSLHYSFGTELIVRKFFDILLFVSYTVKSSKNLILQSKNVIKSYFNVNFHNCVRSCDWFHMDQKCLLKLFFFSFGIKLPLVTNLSAFLYLELQHIWQFAHILTHSCSNFFQMRFGFFIKCGISWMTQGVVLVF